jgi:hypothetical protein
LDNIDRSVKVIDHPAFPLLEFHSTKLLGLLLKVFHDRFRSLTVAGLVEGVAKSSIHTKDVQPVEILTGGGQESIEGIKYVSATIEDNGISRIELPVQLVEEDDFLANPFQTGALFVPYRQKPERNGHLPTLAIARDQSLGALPDQADARLGQMSGADEEWLFSRVDVLVTELIQAAEIAPHPPVMDGQLIATLLLATTGSAVPFAVLDVVAAALMPRQKVVLKDVLTGEVLGVVSTVGRLPFRKGRMSLPVSVVETGPFVSDRELARRHPRSEETLPFLGRGRIESLGIFERRTAHRYNVIILN